MRETTVAMSMMVTNCKRLSSTTKEIQHQTRFQAGEAGSLAIDSQSPEWQTRILAGTG